MFSFIILITVAIWFFQMGLLDAFYTLINRQQMENTYDEIAASVDGDLTATAEWYASDTGMCIKVYKIGENGTLTEVVDCPEAFGCVVHAITREEIEFLYERALEEGGSYYHLFQMIKPDPLPEEELPGDGNGDGVVSLSAENGADVGSSIELPHDYSTGETPMEGISTDRLILARLTEGATPHLIVLDCAVTPLASITRTLRAQLVIVTLLLLVSSVLIALWISHRISAPVVELNDKAKYLAEGNYQVDFTVHGYREVTELSKTLNTAAEELSRIDRIQKDMMANVSHDLRTPLTMIKGYSEMMHDVPSEMTPENMQVITDEADRLSGLVSDLLELSRYQSGTIPAAPVLFDLTRAVDETVNRYRHLKAEDGYRFLWEGGETAEVWADRNHILRAFCNLLNNAINFSGADLTVEIAVRNLETGVRVEVTDHGVGIPEEELDDVWARYYRSDRTKGKRAGTGLGLSIVRHIVEANGGTYGVFSRVGEGSTFWFELPYATAVDTADE